MDYNPKNPPRSVRKTLSSFPIIGDIINTILSVRLPSHARNTYRDRYMDHRGLKDHTENIDHLLALINNLERNGMNIQGRYEITRNYDRIETVVMADHKSMRELLNRYSPPKGHIDAWIEIKKFGDVGRGSLDFQMSKSAYTGVQYPLPTEPEIKGFIFFTLPK